MTVKQHCLVIISLFFYSQTHGMDKKVHPNDELLDTSRPDYVFVAQEAHANARQNKLIRWNPDDIWYAQEVGPVPVEVTMHAADGKTARRLIYGGIHITDAFSQKSYEIPRKKLCNALVKKLYNTNTSYPIVITENNKKDQASTDDLSVNGIYAISLLKRSVLSKRLLFNFGHELGHIDLLHNSTEKEQDARNTNRRRCRNRINYLLENHDGMKNKKLVSNLAKMCQELQKEELYCDAFASTLGSTLKEKIEIINAGIDFFSPQIGLDSCLPWKLESHPSPDSRTQELKEHRTSLIKQNRKDNYDFATLLGSFVFYSQIYGMDTKIQPKDELLDTSRPDYVFVAKDPQPNARQNKLISWNPDDIWYAQEVGPVPVEVTMHATDGKTARRLIYGGIHVTDAFLQESNEIPRKKLCNAAVKILHNKNISYPVIITEGTEARSYFNLDFYGTYQIQLTKCKKLSNLPILREFGHELGHLDLEYNRNAQQRYLRCAHEQLLTDLYNYSIDYPSQIGDSIDPITAFENSYANLEKISKILQMNELYCDRFAITIGETLEEKMGIINERIKWCEHRLEKDDAGIQKFNTHPTYEARKQASEKYRSELLQQYQKRCE